MSVTPDPKYTIKDNVAAEVSIPSGIMGDGEEKVVSFVTNEIWNQVCQSEQMGDIGDFLKMVATSKSARARKFTAIDAYAQIKMATQLFGPFGCGWGVRNVQVIMDVPMTKYTKAGDRDGRQVMFAFHFFYNWKGMEHRAMIINDVFLDHSGDSAKKAMTDSITKFLSYLGFNYDVFLGRFNGVKTIQSPANDEERAAFMAAIKGMKPEKKKTAIDFHEKQGWNKDEVVADTKRFLEIKAKVDALNAQQKESEAPSTEEEA